jgi:hypothetical protein
MIPSFVDKYRVLCNHAPGDPWLLDRKEHAACSPLTCSLCLSSCSPETHRAHDTIKGSEALLSEPLSPGAGTADRVLFLLQQWSNKSTESVLHRCVSPNHCWLLLIKLPTPGRVNQIHLQAGSAAAGTCAQDEVIPVLEAQDGCPSGCQSVCLPQLLIVVIPTSGLHGRCECCSGLLLRRLHPVVALRT